MFRSGDDVRLVGLTVLAVLESGCGSDRQPTSTVPLVDRFQTAEGAERRGLLRQEKVPRRPWQNGLLTP